MNKKYDDEFFDELDKTTDLLKAFKPHVSTTDSLNELDDISDLYSSFSKKTVEQNRYETVKKEEPKYETVKQEPKKYENIKQEPKSFEYIDKKDYNTVDNKASKLNTKQASKIENIEKQKAKINKKKTQDKTDINEIIDKISVTVEETKNKQKTAKIKKEKKEKKKHESEKVKFSPFELAFCAFSVLFIIGCFAVYGSRFMKYYRVYNPKSQSGKSLQLLTTAVAKNSPLVYENDGLYMVNGEYVFKGKNVNNYLRFSNFTWRIIKTNSDGTIDIVLDDYINTLSWANRNKTYLESDIHKYLNEYFINYLDKSYLTQTVICKDEVNDLKSFSCESKNTENYVRLLSVSDFLNSKTTTTYISDEKSTLWLNTVSSDKVWHINGINLSLAQPTRLLGIKPVVRLKSGIALVSGSGTVDDPFMISEESNKISVGDYVKIRTDTYIVYDINDNKLNLVLNKSLPLKQRFGATFEPTNNTSLAFILNTTLYNSIAYRDILLDKEWNVGAYNTTYEDITSKKVVAKIGLYDLRDLKFNNKLQDYYLINSFNSKPFLYGAETVTVNPNMVQNVRPAICISNRAILSGEGTEDNPYVLEA